MNTDTLNRRPDTTPPRRDAIAKERTAVVRLVPEISARELDTDGFSARMLRDAVREAGLFQRSVLGHLDHQEWRDRVRADGQRLIDLLSEIGFRPTRQN
ncbi:hypothetical protein [Novosphingobium resinovorum]|uniref:hypothetical protein n=1 Tax=Novosphingobium resinovorum TaxID=158500 RepID=UPI002ED3D6A2|nr:hypothetical protein [Novosphingobium resinovorum]